MASTHCTLCSSAFGYFKWPHSCHACGHTFCNGCSDHTIRLTPSDLILLADPNNIRDYTKKQRVCNNCYVRVRKAHANSKKSISQTSVSGPTFFDEYTLGDKVGSGGTSTVRLATNRSGEQFAVKVMKKSDLSPQDIAAVSTEVKVLETLKHPNIVRMYDFYDESGVFYLVMEAIGGGELFDRIVKRTTYSEKEARDLVRVLLDALKFMHDRHIVHRDLKPENLMLTSDAEDAEVKIVDFGFAATEVQGNNLLEQLGTPAYIAPEILNHQRYGKAVDMWSFGVILYILLGGYLPFHHHDTQVMYNKIRKGQFEFHPKYWHKISADAKELIRGLLTLNPMRRLTVDDALKHPWLLKDDQKLEDKKLDNSLAQLKKFQAAKKFKGAVKAVMAVQRMKRLVGAAALASGTSNSSNATVESETVSEPSTPATPASVKLPHTMQANYVLTNEVLGEGFYAKVYNGIANQTKEEVAIKVFTKKKMQKNEYDSLLQEIEIVKSLDHENIVKYYDFFDEEEKCYVVMEKICGGELFDRIVRKAHYSEREAKELTKVLLLAIKHMHDKDIIHRDIKPENLMLTSDNNDAEVKLVDFGFATKVSGFDQTLVCGTIGYMAPEIVRKLPYGKPVDMWALGVVLYILLCGYPPFYHDNQNKLAEQIIRGHYAFHPQYWVGVSEDAKDLISRLLDINPQTRYTVDQALNHAWILELDDVLEGKMLTAGLNQLRKFQARKKFRAAIKAVMMIERVKRIVSMKKTNSMSGGDISIGEDLPPIPTADSTQTPPPPAPEK